MAEERKMAAHPAARTTICRGKQENLRSMKPDYNDIYRKNYGKGQVLFTGPDGMKDHKTKTLDPTFIGRVEKAGESTDNLSYIWRAGRQTPHPVPKYKMVGEIGWHVAGNLDRSLLLSRQQITLGEFRQACEDRYTHRNQSPWYPVRSRSATAIGSRRHDGNSSPLPDGLQQTRIKRVSSATSRPKTATSTIGQLQRHSYRNRPASPGSSSSGSFQASTPLLR